MHLIYARKIDCVEELREGAIDDKIEDVINYWKDGDVLTPPINVSDPKCLQTPDYSVDVIAQCVRWYLAYSLSLLDHEDIDG